MKAASLLAVSLLYFAAVPPCTARTQAAQSHKPIPAASVPRLGEDAPELLRKRAAAKPCAITDGRSDPCSTLTIAHDRITVAWDATTHRVTYLYSTTLDTDDDIRTGDVLAIDSDSPITPFPGEGQPHRFVTVDWCDTDADLTGDSEWCAVMLPTRPRSGRVIGFVQSLYLYLPDIDPGPMHRVSRNIRSRALHLRPVIWSRR